MKARVDEERCRGHGICTTICPSVFEINDDGYSVVTVAEIPAEFEDAVRDAVKDCPEQAIEAS
ncbi:ferredoxin [Mycobacterium sp. MFM001]|uniref:ferredoxin n=1 Tax=Mycobacterium sp. MFM001 TaxID=2049453 RepID=UPI000DA4E710|nr:ferredoxin [Mycobacterium sp. MFM001]GBE67605.1 ferredoxin [Mycobacterium sp. MFM001]